MIFDNIKKIEGKLSITISCVAALVFTYNAYIKDNPISVYVKNQKIQGEALNAELDLDKDMFEKYHVELYHANKNSKGQYKYSYLDYKGRYYKAQVDITTGYWEYLDKGKRVNFIKELGH
jgi:hypothetical protein